MSKITLSDAIAKKTVLDECDGTEKVVLSYTAADGKNGMASVPVSYFNTGSSSTTDIKAYWYDGNFIITKNDIILSSIQPANQYRNGLMSYQDKAKIDNINNNISLYNYWIYYNAMHTYCLPVFGEKTYIIDIINKYKQYGYYNEVDVSSYFNAMMFEHDIWAAFCYSDSYGQYIILNNGSTINPYDYFNTSIDPLTDNYFCKAVRTNNSDTSFYLYIYDLKKFMNLNGSIITTAPIVSLSSNHAYAYVYNNTVKFIFN